MARKAVFLDKDGTLLVDVPYNVQPESMRLAPGALEGIRLIDSAGYALIVVSNQSGVARGYFPESALRAVERRLEELLAQAGVSLAGFYYCPHYPHGAVVDYAVECQCRKPQPGLILQAAEEHEIDLPESFFVGDILDDVEAGRRAGCRTILLDNGGETEWRFSELRKPHYVARDLSQAAKIIIGAEPRHPGTQFVHKAVSLPTSPLGGAYD